MTSAQQPFEAVESYDIVVIGSLVSDISCTYARRPDDGDDARPRQGSSNPARITQCVGGVAHNIALSAHYLGPSVLLVSVVANDSAGAYLLRELEKEGLSTQGIWKLETSEENGEVRTGQYVGNYNHDKEFLFGMADVKLMLHPETEVERHWKMLFSKARPKVVILDTTFSSSTIDIITNIASDNNVKAIVEPVSHPRAKDFALTRSFRGSKSTPSRNQLDMITPNADELNAMFQGTLNNGLVHEDMLGETTDLAESLLPRVTHIHIKDQALLKSCISKVVLLLAYVPIILVTLDSEGCLLAMRKTNLPSNSQEQQRAVPFNLNVAGMALDGVLGYFPSPYQLEGTQLVSVNGAGDSLVGAVAMGWLAALKEETGAETVRSRASVSWERWCRIVEEGQWAALATLQHDGAVSPALQDLSGYKEKLLSNMNKQ